MTALQQDTRRIRKQLNEANRKIQLAKQETLEVKRNVEQSTALRMLQDGLNIETVAKYLSMPIEAIQSLAQQQFGTSQSGLA